MRPLETTRAAVAAATQELSPPPAAATTRAACDPQVHDCRWWPYSNSGDFGANTAMVVVILLVALICALAINAAVRCFLRAATTRRRPSPTPSSVTPPLVDSSSTKMVYSSSSSSGMMMMKLNDCPICLSEFVEGEGVRVLDRCKHGFHVRCIDTWLSSHSSCPTCRATCFALPHNSADVAASCHLERGGVIGRDDDRELRGGVDGGPPTTAV